MPFGLLDPSIIARGATPVDNPVDAMGAVLRVQQLRQQAAMAPLRMQQLQGDVQEQQIRNQNMLRDQEEQKAFGKLVAESGSDPDKIEEAVNKTITSPNVLAKANDVISKMRARNATMSAKQQAEAAKQSLYYANKLESIKAAKSNPDVQQALWYKTAQEASEAKDEDGNPLIPPGSVDPSRVPDESTLSLLQNHLDKTGAFHLQQSKLKDEADKTAKAEIDRKAAQRKALVDMHAEAAQSFRGVTGKADYDSRLADFESQDDEHKAYAKRFLRVLPSGDVTTMAKSLSTIESRGLTPEQRQQAGDRAATRDMTQQQRTEQARRDDETARHNRAMEANDYTRAAKERGETANAKAVDRRQWERDVSKLKEEEENTAAIRSNLENAIKNGRTYVDEGGKTKTMATATKDDNTTAQDLISRMRSQYEMLTNRQKRIVEDKNRFGEAMGMDITVPTAKIHGNLDKDLERVKGFGQQPAATPATTEPVTPSPVAAPQTSAQPTARPAKIATLAHIQAYAKTKGISVDQATKEFTSSGWQVK